MPCCTTRWWTCIPLLLLTCRATRSRRHRLPTPRRRRAQRAPGILLTLPREAPRTRLHRSPAAIQAPTTHFRRRPVAATQGLPPAPTPTQPRPILTQPRRIPTQPRPILTQPRLIPTQHSPTPTQHPPILTRLRRMACNRKDTRAQHLWRSEPQSVSLPPQHTYALPWILLPVDAVS
jgi:hypothetical protein